MKPMLAVAVELAQVKFPVYASPKLDGIRAVKQDGVMKSRTLKDIPNKAVQDILRDSAWNGMDGELIVGPRTAPDVFNVTTSGIMSREKLTLNFTYWVFDLWDLTDTYEERLQVLSQFNDTQHIKILPQVLIQSEEGLIMYERQMLQAGYEGIMLRSPASLYKFGRSTVNQQYLLKRKPLSDAEGQIIGFEYLRRNHNEAVTNDVGYTQRSQAQENLVTDHTRLGALIIKVTTGEFTGAEVKIGTGFTDQVRQDLIDQETTLIGKTVTFTYQSEGAKDKPRFPSYKGMRKD